MITYAERLIAFRYLRARREEGLISVIAGFSLIGIALGVATLIVVLSVMRGVREEMIESIIGLEGHITVASHNTRGIDNYDEIAARIRNIPGVKSAIPIVQGQVMANARGMAAGAMISGLRAEDMRFKPLLMKKIITGSPPSGESGEQAGVLIGQRMAQRLNLKVGDSITLISPEGRATPAGMVPRIKAYPVAGLFNIGMFAYDNGLVVMPFSQAQVFFKLKDASLDPVSSGLASAIEVIGDNPDNAPELARIINAQTNEQFRVYDWKSSNDHIFRAVMVQRNVMFLILMLIILVASFNIVSSLIMLVREKGRDIGILRTMGATRGMIQRIFIMSGMSVGVIGALSGVALGLIIALNTENIQHWLETLTGHKLLADELYFLSSLPAKIDAAEVSMVAGMALALSFLASLYPAWRAARLDPAEVLRYE